MAIFFFFYWPHTVKEKKIKERSFCSLGRMHNNTTQGLRSVHHYFTRVTSELHWVSFFLFVSFFSVLGFFFISYISVFYDILQLTSPFPSGHTKTHISLWNLLFLQDTLQLTSPFEFSLFFRTYNSRLSFLQGTLQLTSAPWILPVLRDTLQLTSPFEFSLFFRAYYNSHLPFNSLFPSGQTTTHISLSILPVLQDTLQLTSAFHVLRHSRYSPSLGLEFSLAEFFHPHFLPCN